MYFVRLGGTSAINSNPTWEPCTVQESGNYCRRFWRHSGFLTQLQGSVELSVALCELGQDPL